MISVTPVITTKMKREISVSKAKEVIKIQVENRQTLTTILKNMREYGFDVDWVYAKIRAVVFRTSKIDRTNYDQNLVEYVLKHKNVVG